MKKFIFLICLMLFSTVALAGPVAGDGLLGYSDIGGGSSNVVDIGSMDTSAAKTTNTKQMTTVVQAKTGAGVIYTAGLDSLNRMQPSKRLPLTEVGWR